MLFELLEVAKRIIKASLTETRSSSSKSERPQAAQVGGGRRARAGGE